MASLEKKLSKLEKKASGSIQDKKGNIIFEIVKASIIALLITLVLVLVAALIMTFVEMGDLAKDIINQVIRGGSILAAAILSFKEKKLGWLKGLISGLVFVILSFVVYSLIGGSFVFGLPLVVDLGTGIVMGIISGIIAVNIKK